MHSFEFNGLTYDWRRTQDGQIHLWGNWTEGREKRSACLLTLEVEELRLLLETGMKVLKDKKEGC